MTVHGHFRDERAIRRAIAHLQLAREHLTFAHAKRAAAKVRRALKSAEGAERHAIGMNIRNGFEARLHNGSENV